MKYFRASYRLALLLTIIVSLFLTSLFISFCYGLGLPKLLGLPSRDHIIAYNMKYHFRLLIWGTGMVLEVHEKLDKPIGQSGCLFLSNHISYLDIILLAALYPTAFVAKTEVASWQFLGLITRLMNTIYVTREDVWSRVRCIRSLEEGLTRLNYCIFPEGTTTNFRKPKLKNWKSGNLWAARNPEVRVIAIGITYEDHLALSWIDDMTLLPHLWRVLQRESVRAKFTIAEIPHDDMNMNEVRSSSHYICHEIGELCTGEMESGSRSNKLVNLNPAETSL